MLYVEKLEFQTYKHAMLEPDDTNDNLKNEITPPKKKKKKQTVRCVECSFQKTQRDMKLCTYVMGDIGG